MCLFLVFLGSFFEWPSTPPWCPHPPLEYGLSIAGVLGRFCDPPPHLSTLITTKITFPCNSLEITGADFLYMEIARLYSARERRTLKAPGAHRSQRAGSTTTLPPTAHRNLDAKPRNHCGRNPKFMAKLLRFLIIWPAAASHRRLAQTSWRTPGAHLAHPVTKARRTPVALLSHSCRTPVALLAHSCLIPWRTPGSAGADTPLEHTADRPINGTKRHLRRVPAQTASDAAPAREGGRERRAMRGGPRRNARNDEREVARGGGPRAL